jgi:hypothetical protein
MLVDDWHRFAISRDAKWYHEHLGTITCERQPKAADKIHFRSNFRFSTGHPIAEDCSLPAAMSPAM